MYRYIIINFLIMFMAFGAMASDGNNTTSGWADIPSFCKTQSATANEYKKCVRVVSKYKEATRERFKNLPAEHLRRIGRRITDMADENSDHNKKMRDAVKGIGDALRKPIEVPEGVRRRQFDTRQQQQQYIK